MNGILHYKDMTAVYDEEFDLWGIFPMGSEQTVDNLIFVVHGNDRQKVRKEMERLYNARFPLRKDIWEGGE